MNNRYFNFFILIACVFCVHFSMNAQIFQYENQLIEQIDIKIMNVAEGVACDTSGILARIKSRTGSLFSQTEFDNDLKTLARDFDRIDPSLDTVNGKIFITLKVWPKPIIRTITWFGNNKISGDKLQSELAIAPGSIFDRQTFNEAFHKLKVYYIKKGFFEAELNYDLILNSLSNEVDIQVTINEGRSGRIKKIKFLNFTEAEQMELAEAMVTKEYWIFTSWMTDEGTYHQDMMQQDEMMIVNYLQNKGYADAQVQISIEEAKGCNDRIVVTISADRGERYTIGKIKFSGNTLFTNEEIWSRFTISEGSCYSPEKIRQTISCLTKLYGRFGYIDATINYEPSLVAEGCVYDIDFTIEEGDQFRVGLIKVFGNCSTETQVILHETFLIPGEIFNLDKLEKTEERLQNVGYFKNVNVYAVKSEGPCELGDNYRDVHIEVEETSTGNFGLFMGFSTVENIFGGFNITEKNFNHKGFCDVRKRGFCALRGGGEYAHFTATIGAKSQNYVLSWSKPYFMDTPWMVGFDIERSVNQYISKDYKIESMGFTVRGMYPINQFVKAGTHYRLRYSNVNIKHDDHSPQLREEARNNGIISAVGASWIYDSTNHPLDPTEGFKSKVEGELAGLGGIATFFSCAYINSYYWQFCDYDKKGVWRFRADARFIQPLFHTTYRRIPLDERLFLGGEETVRGYRPYRLGPVFEGTHDPRGGLSMQFLSLEYTRPLFKRVEGFVFIDAGQLSRHTWHFGRINVSAGYGLKVSILPGAPPLMVGMGYPINPKNHSDVKRFFLTVGGTY